MRYVLLQIPDLVLLLLALAVLDRWLDLSREVVAAVVGVWLVKVVLVLPLARRALAQAPVLEPTPSAGSVGTARTRLDPAGYGRFRGELWRCEITDDGEPLEEGARLRVRDVDGLSLVVERAPDDGS
jgi:membrane-bound ClpP family serine protease